MKRYLPALIVLTTILISSFFIYGNVKSSTADEVLIATDDVMVDSLGTEQDGYTGPAYGTSFQNELWVGNDDESVGAGEGGISESAIKFDLSTLDQPVESAKLLIYVVYTRGNPFVSVYGSQDDEWSESDDFGTDIGNLPSKDEELLLEDYDITMGTWKSIDITDFIVTQLEGNKQATLVLAGQRDGDHLFTFRDRSYGNDQEPRLEITYKRATIEEIEDQALDELTYGYEAGERETKTVHVIRDGAGQLTGLTVALTNGDTEAFEMSPPLSDTLNDETPTTTFTITAKDGLHAGTYEAEVTVSANETDDVTFTVTQVVNKATPEVTTWPTASQLTYGQTLSETTLSGGIVAGDVVGTFTFDDGTITPGAGTYAASVTFTPADTVNYHTVSGTVNVEVEKRELTIGGSFTVEDKEYDGTTAATLDTNALGLSGVISGDNVNLEPVVAFAEATVGENIAVTLTDASSLSGTDAGNYTLSLEGAPTAEAEITPKALSVSGARAEDKEYDGTDAATISGATLAGVIGGDDVELDQVVGTFAQAHVGNHLSVAVVVTLRGEDAGNYTVDAPTGLTADITAKELSIDGIFVVEDKEYDGTTEATVTTHDGLTLTGVVESETIELTDVEAVFTDRNVGERTVELTAANLAGETKDNYTLSLTNAPTATAEITARVLTVAGSFTVEDKEYDGTTAATLDTNGLELIGVISGDNVNLEPVVAFAEATVGENIAVTLTDASSLSGTDAGNYTLTLEGAPATTANIMTGSPAQAVLTMFPDRITMTDFTEKDAIVTAEVIVTDIFNHIIRDGREAGTFMLTAVPAEAEEGTDYEFFKTSGTLTIKGNAPKAFGVYTITYTNATDTSVTASAHVKVLNHNANLSSLAMRDEASLDMIRLTPDFEASNSSYTANVAYSVNQVNIRATTEDHNATVSVNGAVVTSGEWSDNIGLNVGSNTITIVSTAEDGTVKTYTISIERQSQPSSGGGGGLPGSPGTPGTTDPQDPPSTSPEDDESEGTEEPDGVYRAFIKGNPDGTFGPNDEMTRAQLATMLARVIGYEDMEQLSMPSFRDVDAEHWAAGVIGFVQEKGLFTGDQDGNFRPNEFVTRAEMAVIIARYKGLTLPGREEGEATFTDIGGHWAAKEIMAVREAGIVNGYTDGTFRPNDKLTRIEAVVILNRMLGRGPLYGVDTPSWTDVPADHWAFGYIESASRDYKFTRDEDGREWIWLDD